MSLKNPLLSAGFERVNFGSSGKHDNHYATENDDLGTYVSFILSSCFHVTLFMVLFLIMFYYVFLQICETMSRNSWLRKNHSDH
jgi:hypothetical protein